MFSICPETHLSILVLFPLAISILRLYHSGQSPPVDSFVRCHLILYPLHFLVCFSRFVVFQFHSPPMILTTCIKNQTIMWHEQVSDISPPLKHTRKNIIMRQHLFFAVIHICCITMKPDKTGDRHASRFHSHHHAHHHPHDHGLCVSRPLATPTCLPTRAHTCTPPTL